MDHAAAVKAARPRSAPRVGGRRGGGAVRRTMNGVQQGANPGPIRRTVARLFEANDWEVEPLDGHPGYAMEVQGDSGTWDCVVVADDELGYFVFYSIAPLDVPEDRRAAMAELVCRANFGTLSGTLELDMDDGMVRYKTALDLSPIDPGRVGGDEALEDLISDLIVTNLTTFDRVAPAVAQVALAGEEPAVALAAALADVGDNGSTPH